MDTNKERYSFDDFIELIAILRGENGCPWDRAQSHESLRKYLIEESYEVINEIDEKNNKGICEELGDVLLQIVMHAQLAKEERNFDIQDVVDGITKKMIYRHPFVFEKDKIKDVDEALESFGKRKEKEKGIVNIDDKIARIPASYPMLLKTYKLFSILSKEYVLENEKLNENLMNNDWDKLKTIKDKEAAENLIGELLFEICKLSHSVDVNPEMALGKAYKNFQKEWSKRMKFKKM